MGRINKFVLDCLSFNTPKAIVFNISSIFFILLITPLNYLNSLPSFCIFKNFILPLVFRGNCPSNGLFAECHCPACGLTRALSSLLKGNLSIAINYNFLAIPVLIVMVTLLVVNVVKIIKKS
jgi:hypothetical protein